MNIDEALEEMDKAIKLSYRDSEMADIVAIDILCDYLDSLGEDGRKLAERFRAV